MSKGDVGVLIVVRPRVMAYMLSYSDSKPPERIGAHHKMTITTSRRGWKNEDTTVAMAKERHLGAGSMPTTRVWVRRVTAVRAL